jgi:hypothetical protein
MSALALAKPLRSYLAGNWNDPPRDVAKRLTENQFLSIEIVGQWWDREHDSDRQHNATLEGQLQLAEHYDIFVLCMLASEKGGEQHHHHYAGSHLGAGIALHAGKRVFVLGNVAPYTALLRNVWCQSVGELLDRIVHRR